MSRGLGKIQAHIVRILSGTVRRKVYAGRGPLLTKELMAELIEAGLMRDATTTTERRISRHAVVRACRGLVLRGVVEGRYRADCDNGAMSIEWEAVRPEPAAPFPGPA